MTASLPWSAVRISSGVTVLSEEARRVRTAGWCGTEQPGGDIPEHPLGQVSVPVLDERGHHVRVVAALERALSRGRPSQSGHHFASVSGRVCLSVRCCACLCVVCARQEGRRAGRQAGRQPHGVELRLDGLRLLGVGSHAENTQLHTRAPSATRRDAAKIVQLLTPPRA
jgi:hypothetical protein